MTLKNNIQNSFRRSKNMYARKDKKKPIYQWYFPDTNWKTFFQLQLICTKQNS